MASANESDSDARKEGREPPLSAMVKASRDARAEEHAEMMVEWRRGAIVALDDDTSKRPLYEVIIIIGVKPIERLEVWKRRKYLPRNNSQ